MLRIVSLYLSFFKRYLYRAYVTLPVPTAANNSSPFFGSLKGDKNLITLAQVVKFYFFFPNTR